MSGLEHKLQTYTAFSSLQAFEAQNTICAYQVAQMEESRVSGKVLHQSGCFGGEAVGSACQLASSLSMIVHAFFLTENIW